MPVTAPTSSAIVTTRIARLILTFQLVKTLGIIAGSISLMKYCTVVGRNDRIMWRSSRGTPRIASRASTRKTGPQTTTSTKPMRNSTPGNQSTANKIQDTTGTAIKSRIIGCKYFSSGSERYIAIASARPRTKEAMSAPMTRASVTTTSIGVMVATLFAIRTRLGIANGGIPSTGARCDNTSQAVAKTRRETKVWRGKLRSGTDSRCASWGINDLLVRHVGIEPSLHRAFHHVDDRLACGRLPGRLDDHLQTLALDCSGENARRQLQRFVGNLVGRGGFRQHDFGDVLQRREQHLRPVRNARDRIRAHG